MSNQDWRNDPDFECPDCPKCGKQASHMLENVSRWAQLTEDMTFEGTKEIIDGSDEPDYCRDYGFTLRCDSCDKEWSSRG